MSRMRGVSRVGKWKISHVNGMGDKKRILRRSGKRASEREGEETKEDDDEDKFRYEM